MTVLLVIALVAATLVMALTAWPITATKRADLWSWGRYIVILVMTGGMLIAIYLMEHR